jgi:hypothetical protein
MPYTESQCFLSMGFVMGGLQFCPLQPIDPNNVLQSTNGSSLTLVADQVMATNLGIQPVSLALLVERVAVVQFYNHLCDKPEQWHTATNPRTEPFREGGGIRFEGWVLGASPQETSNPESLPEAVPVRMFFRVTPEITWAYLQPIQGVIPAQGETFPTVHYLPVSA